MFIKGPIHKGCLHISGRGEGVGKKWANADRGERVVSQIWTSVWKKIIATILVKFTEIIWQYVCI